MNELSLNKATLLNALTNEDGVIAALAIDQRGALKKMMTKHKGEDITDDDIIRFKQIVSEELIQYCSSILLDPEFGLPAANVRADNAGLLLAYEKTGYDASKEGRLPDLLEFWSAMRLKEQGADAVKFLLYYDADEPEAINNKKQAFVERMGSECIAQDVPFFLELVSYDAKIADANSKEYARVKPHKVISMMKEFSNPRYHVDVLKVEVPVNMKFVAGFSSEAESVYSEREAAEYFCAQSTATPLPFIFLSAGVEATLFQETLRFAKLAGSTFNGVLCGRATWAEAVEPFICEGEQAAREWLRQQGRQNIAELNQVLKETATSWQQRLM
ncbi:TPA: tagatose-bisphosphate aldolase [Escherichia coli]|uniref:tagatose-bisphosphate aldolase n=1 Tax=Escherichia coli TaxID=562 RepID=UPI002879E08F|nr:tagatose-bisphosphate aldolase [Escherichia coli]MDS1591682.1 tagatose-bisphosphate aldolase [Escherichia coli]HAW8121099.1 tagatose-bisphosphate aldolase [Escherichia coli]